MTTQTKAKAYATAGVIVGAIGTGSAFSSGTWWVQVADVFMLGMTVTLAVIVWRGPWRS